jgi:hypothetical protein
MPTAHAERTFPPVLSPQRKATRHVGAFEGCTAQLMFSTVPFDSCAVIDLAEMIARGIKDRHACGRGLEQVVSCIRAVWIPHYLHRLRPWP